MNTQLSDQASQRMNYDIQSVVNSLSQVPISNGQLLSGIALRAGENEIAHKFGKELQGWLLVRIDADSKIYELPSFDLKKYLKLYSSADCTISLWVF